MKEKLQAKESARSTSPEPPKKAKKSRKKCKTSTKQIERAMKVATALQLRALGYKQHEVAEAMDVSEATACRLIQEGISGLTERPAKELLAAELSWINALKEAVIEKKLEFAQIDRLIRLHERTSKLLGLEAPTKIAETNPDGTAIDHTTPDQKREQIVQRMWLGEDTEAKYGRDRSAISAAPAGDDGGTPESSRA
jgi:predicted transcriptional regulator